jgi:hypothetical protein
MATKTTAEEATDEVVVWRCGLLVGAGFSRSCAAQIAGDPRFDVHALIELVERGCPADLATRILAPLEEENLS